jgi:hypothetical protein
MRDQCDKHAIERRMKKVDSVMDKINEWHEIQELCKTLDRVNGFNDPKYLTGQRRTWFDSDIPTTKGDK